MKKGFLYILFFLFLFNATAFNQVFKLPVLIAHYLEHRQLNHDIGFLDFMSMHYWGKDINDQDQDRDNQLPFKSVESPSAFQPALPVVKLSLVKHDPYTVQIEQPIVQENHLPDPALASLFRPPKI